LETEIRESESVEEPEGGLKSLSASRGRTGNQAEKNVGGKKTLLWGRGGKKNGEAISGGI